MEPSVFSGIYGFCLTFWPAGHLTMLLFITWHSSANERAAFLRCPLLVFNGSRRVYSVWMALMLIYVHLFNDAEVFSIKRLLTLFIIPFLINVELSKKLAESVDDYGIGGIQYGWL